MVTHAVNSQQVENVDQEMKDGCGSASDAGEQHECTETYSEHISGQLEMLYEQREQQNNNINVNNDEQQMQIADCPSNGSGQEDQNDLSRPEEKMKYATALVQQLQLSKVKSGDGIQNENSNRQFGPFHHNDLQQDRVLKVNRLNMSKLSSHRERDGMLGSSLSPINQH